MTKHLRTVALAPFRDMKEKRRRSKGAITLILDRFEKFLQQVIRKAINSRSKVVQGLHGCFYHPFSPSGRENIVR